MSIPELSLGNMRKAIASKTPIRKDGKSFINVYVRTIKNMTSAEKENERIHNLYKRWDPSLPKIYLNIFHYAYI